MKLSSISVAFFLLLISIGVTANTQQNLADKKTDAKSAAALNFKMKAIDGKEVNLSKYSGKVVVFVNVASKCGFTPQYEDLQDLHKKYGSKGVAIVGVPCNQFRGQEPGTNSEIAEFCKSKYGVEFDLLSKVDVNGDKQCELYKYLTSQDLKPVGKGPIKWNFEKIVVDKSGKPIARFGSRTKPSSKEFVEVLEGALAGTKMSGGASATGHYSHKSEKLGKSYFLFTREVKLKNSDKVRSSYFFAKDKTHPTGKPLAAVPEGKVVSETKNGMLVLKNAPAKK